METAKLSVKALASACAILWGGAVFVVSIANWIWPDYGIAFLDLVASVYPGYDYILPTLGTTLIGTVYALIDGAIAGCLLALLYNFCACKCKKQA